jgi:hypothetical protein
MVFGGIAFGVIRFGLGSQEWGTYDRISVLTRKKQRTSSLSLHYTARNWPLKAWKTALTRSQIGQHLDLGLSQSQEQEEINFCCLSYQIYGGLLWRPWQTKTETTLVTSQSCNTVVPLYPSAVRM